MLPFGHTAGAHIPQLLNPNNPDPADLPDPVDLPNLLPDPLDLLALVTTASQSFDLASCLLPVGRADQRRAHLALERGMGAHGVSTHAASVWIRQGLEVRSRGAGAGDIR